MSKNIIDIKGIKYNNLTALEFIEIKNKKTYWSFLCNCGNIIVKRKENVIGGLCKSCGCKNFEKGNDLIYKAAFLKLFSRYKSGAKKRGLLFEINELEFESLILKNCHYCNSKPNTNAKYIYKNNNVNSFKYNGIDRVDNTIGYTYKNCVTACNICNRAKNNLTYNVFKNWIENIIINNK